MSKNLYIGNLPYSVNEDHLRDLFSAEGKVTRVKVITDHETGRSKGFGFVEMPRSGEARAAIKELNYRDVGGNKIRVKKVEKRAEGARRPDSKD